MQTIIRVKILFFVRIFDVNFRFSKCLLCFFKYKDEDVCLADSCILDSSLP